MPLSTFLSGRAQTQLRGVRWLSLSESGAVLSVTNTADTGGGVSQVWAAGTTVPCRIDPLTGGEEITANRISDESDPPRHCSRWHQRVANQRFVIDGRGTFDITAVREATGELVRVFEVNRS